MRDMVAAEQGDSDNRLLEAPDQFYYDADYVLDTWLERKLWGLYPEAGGYNDQDDYLMQDWRKLTMYYLRAKSGIFSAVKMPDSAPSWQTLMRD